MKASWAIVLGLFICAMGAASASDVTRTGKPALFGIGQSTNITVSGISAGAFFAHQFHVAFSASVTGAGLIAGGPYWCAQDNEVLALSLMNNAGMIVLSELYAATTYAASLLSIDDPRNLANSRVWIFSGTQDTVVSPGVVQKLLQYYAHYVPDENLVAVFNVSAEHAFIADDFGNACKYLGSPFINNCGLSAAGAMLSTFFGTLRPRVPVVPQNLQTINQAKFVPPPFSPQLDGLADTAYVYVPTQCQASSSNSSKCPVHVAFHGCSQSSGQVGDTFAQHAGYNGWAEANGIIVLYPQARANLLNPKACFDWWGYSGVDYATKLGFQSITVANMLNYLSGSGLPAHWLAAGDSAEREEMLRNPPDVLLSAASTN